MNDRDAEGANLSGYVDLGPDMHDTSAVGTNDDCANQGYPMDFPGLSEGPKNLRVHA